MKLRSLFILISFFTLNSCFIGKSIESGKAKSEFTVENDAIPPEFGDNESVILGILRGRRSYDKYLKSAFKKNYTGKYELITREDLNSEKYSDKEKYRYVFDYSDGSGYTVTYESGRSSSSNYKRFYVQDRLNDKVYQSGAEFTFFAKAMKVYVANLELKRVSN